LLTSDIAGDDYDFWDDLWKVSLTTEEIFELISVEGNIISHELMNVYIIYFYSLPIFLTLLFTQLFTHLLTYRIQMFEF